MVKGAEVVVKGQTLVKGWSSAFGGRWAQGVAMTVKSVIGEGRRVREAVLVSRSKRDGMQAGQ